LTRHRQLLWVILLFYCIGHHTRRQIHGLSLETAKLFDNLAKLKRFFLRFEDSVASSTIGVKNGLL
jgi:hypothetical protein